MLICNATRDEINTFLEGITIHALACDCGFPTP